jgi:hypothetical protein
MKSLVPSIEIREATGAEDLDDGPGLSGMMRGLGGKGIRPSAGVSMQQGGERGAGEGLKEIATWKVRVHVGKVGSCVSTQFCASLP